MASWASKQFVVQDVQYKTTLLPATEGRDIARKLIVALGPAMGELAGMPKASDPKDAEYILMQAIMRFLIDALSAIDGAFLTQMCDAFGSRTVVMRAGGEDTLTPDAFGLHFAGNYQAMFRWLLECAKANGMLDFLSVGISQGDAAAAT
jgi:hypothetical protein